jgi:predicted DNA-binding transcriptional regulator AlpA
MAETNVNPELKGTAVATVLQSFQETLEATLKKVLAEMANRITQTTANVQNGATPLTTKTGIDLSPSEKMKAADLRASLLTGKLPENCGLLIDTKTLAKLLDISVSQIYTLLAAEALLAPIQVGRMKRWRLAEVLEWIDAGCPPQNLWSYRRSDAANKRRK